MKKRPAHAKDFKGKAKCIPARDTFLLPYQSKWVQDRSLVRLMEKSRRIGISYATAYDKVREHSLEGNRVDTWFSSRDELTSREWIIYCKGFAGVLQAAAELHEAEVVDDKGNRSDVLQFANGKRIHSLAGNPDVFAGKGGNVGLDELALRDRPRDVYDIASPTIDWGGRMDIISTHRGARNFFNRLIEDERSGDPKRMRGISLHRVTLQDALEQGFLWKLQTKLPEGDRRMGMDEGDYYDYQMSRSSTPERARQEYMCEPEDEASVFLPYDLLAGSFYTADKDLVAHTEETRDFRGKPGKIRYLLPRGERPEDLPGLLGKLRMGGGSLYHGKDVARKGDLSVDVFGERRDGLLCVRAVVEFQAVQFSKQEDVLYPLIPFCARSLIDETGIGLQFAERAAQKFGKEKVIGISFTRGNKEMLAGPVRTAFEDRLIRIPEDEKFIGDLRMIRKTTIGDRDVFDAEADEDSDSHADRFWAMALCLAAAKPGERNGVWGSGDVAGAMTQRDFKKSGRLFVPRRLS